jgi:hypothetical protein
MEYNLFIWWSVKNVFSLLRLYVLEQQHILRTLIFFVIFVWYSKVILLLMFFFIHWWNEKEIGFLFLAFDGAQNIQSFWIINVVFLKFSGCPLVAYLWWWWMVWNFGGGSAHRFFLWLTSPGGWKSVPNRVVFVDSGSYSLVKFTKLKRIQMGKNTFQWPQGIFW